MTMLIERRKHPHIRVYLPAKLHPKGNHTPLHTLTKDLSLGGLRCLSLKAIPVSMELQIELTVPNNSEVFQLHGRVAWFRSLPESDQYDLGISFSDLPEKTGQHLSAYLDKISL